jgi:hypothetical protein
MDGDLHENAHQSFDLIFADSWPGKFSALELALGMVKPSGFYLIDDLLPQPLARGRSRGAGGGAEGHPQGALGLRGHGSRLVVGLLLATRLA